jgi:protein-S-isoprenylcysteine O-methyltransferase Ste14
VGGVAGTLLANPTYGTVSGFLFLLVFAIWKVVHEERFLVSQFGDEYRHYRTTSWALFPFVY